MLVFVSTLLVAFAVSIQAVQFQVSNNEGGEIWIGILGNPGSPPLENGGFKLKQGEKKSVNAPDNWHGRFWGRTWCNGGSQHCLTGDCGNKVQCNGAGGNPPATLIEIAMKGDHGNDFYDISVVDGFNLKASIKPIGVQGDGTHFSCGEASCPTNINDECPGELQLKNNNGDVVGCKSACLAFNTDETCCRGAHNNPKTCSPTKYSALFRSFCPDAYSYAFDDRNSTYTCKNVAQYEIVFG